MIYQERKNDENKNRLCHLEKKKIEIKIIFLQTYFGLLYKTGLIQSLDSKIKLSQESTSDELNKRGIISAFSFQTFIGHYYWHNA